MVSNFTFLKVEISNSTLVVYYSCTESQQEWVVQLNKIVYISQFLTSYLVNFSKSTISKFTNYFPKFIWVSIKFDAGMFLFLFVVIVGVGITREDILQSAKQRHCGNWQKHMSNFNALERYVNFKSFSHIFWLPIIF